MAGNVFRFLPFRHRLFNWTILKRNAVAVTLTIYLGTQQKASLLVHERHTTCAMKHLADLFGAPAQEGKW